MEKAPNAKKLLLLGLVVAIVAAYFVFDVHEYLRLEYLKQSGDRLQHYLTTYPVASLAAFFSIYVLVTALSLPGAAVMTVAAGALFGVATGVVLVSFASALGATLAFVAARWLFRNSLRRRLGHRLDKIDRGVKTDGAFYLFSMRLVPAIPFFLINLAMGLTPIRTWTFYWVSQVGMLPGTIVYVNAGTQLAEIDSLRGLMSFDIIGAFLLLAAFPWIARSAVRFFERRRIRRKWQRPRAFDRNLVVVGAGSAGLVSAYIGATVNASVTLIEKHRMGGDCLNTGCVPSKALIKSARMAHQTRHLADYGIDAGAPRVDFAAVMERIQGVIGEVAPHDSTERYSAMGVDCRAGHARFLSPWVVEITENGKSTQLSSRNTVIATGARPTVPPIPGLKDMDYLTSDNLWQLRDLPPRLLVLGGGPIGCELAQAFARLGSRVTQVEKNDRLLSRDDPEAGEAVYASMAADGVEVMLATTAARFATEEGETVLYAQRENDDVRLVFDRVLVALGRSPNTEDMGLEELGIETRDNGTLVTDDYLQTAVPGIYACGDVAGPYQFTHTASHQAWYATVNALFGGFRRFKPDYSKIPWTTFTDPEVAHVGLSLAEAQASDVAVEVTRYGIDDLDRAIADGTASGFVKIITRKGSDRILGATIVGPDAGNLLAEITVAMHAGLGLKRLQSAIHVYPTLSEAIKFTAGEWRKGHAPTRLLDWVGRFHRWRLGRGPAVPHGGLAHE